VSAAAATASMDRFYHKADAGPVRIGVGWLSTIGRDRPIMSEYFTSKAFAARAAFSVFQSESGAYLFPAPSRYAGTEIAQKAVRHRLVFNRILTKINRTGELWLN
jgi:hypothetical protein